MSILSSFLGGVSSSMDALQSRGIARWMVYVGLGTLVSIAVVCGLIATSGGSEVSGDTPQERAASISKLSLQKTPTAIAAIARAATSGDTAVRQEGLVALGKFADPQYRPTIQAALTDPDSGVRTAAAGAIGYYADPDSVPELAKLLYDPDEQVRMGAVQGLGRNGSPQAIIQLAEAMQHNNNPNVQIQAMKVVLHKANFSFGHEPNPRDATDWAKKVQTVRDCPTVHNAYAAVTGQTPKR